MHLCEPPQENEEDGQEDNWQNLYKKEADNQTDPRRANQDDLRVSGQSEPNVFGQADHKVSKYNRHRRYDQTDLKRPTVIKLLIIEELIRSSTHAERASKQTERTSSVSSEQRASEQTGHRKVSEPMDRKSGQYDRRSSEPIDHMKSGQDGRRVSAPIQPRESGQDDQAAYDLIDSRKSGLVEQKTYQPGEHRLSDPSSYKSSVQTHHKTHDQITELAEDQAAEDQAGGSIHHHPRVIMPFYREYEKVDDEDDDIDDNQPDLGESDEYDDNIHTSKKGREVDYTLDSKQKDFRDPKDSDINKYKNDEFMKAFNAFDTKATGNLQPKTHNFSPRFPAISSNLNYIIGQENGQIIVTKPDDTSGYQKGRSSIQYQKRRFPSLVYQDPYQISLQYMEKHHILQIFQQITENLVYEKPEDPLSFMLSQVKKMIKDREKNATDDE
ncbi:PREDICTED: uncharacterized protein C3orf30 homolog [Myotis brandtii]|uniref:uncharacterized protein C3orf30 homolog n=1 Tax=Myotis brandtii TaxID=109478 RepID=UPI0003BBEE81|nr:PREDICTED: uncharacterized protein C3orf30 homolog [Myotis brandtii]